MAFGGECSADHRRDRSIADGEVEGGPVGVDERRASTASEYPGDLRDGEPRIAHPLQRPLRPCGIEGVLGRWEGVGIPHRKGRRARRTATPRSRHLQHRRTGVDPDQFAIATQVAGEIECSIAGSAADVEQPFTGQEAELVAFPRPQALSGVPPGRRIHVGDQRRRALRSVDIVVPDVARFR